MHIIPKGKNHPSEPGYILDYTAVSYITQTCKRESAHERQLLRSSSSSHTCSKHGDLFWVPFVARENEPERSSNWCPSFCIKCRHVIPIELPTMPIMIKIYPSGSRHQAPANPFIYLCCGRSPAVLLSKQLNNNLWSQVTIPGPSNAEATVHMVNDLRLCISASSPWHSNGMMKFSCSFDSRERRECSFEPSGLSVGVQYSERLLSGSGPNSNDWNKSTS